MFNFIRENISKIYNSFTAKITSLFSGAKTLTPELRQELEKVFIQADTGFKTTQKIIGALEVKNKNLVKEFNIQELLSETLIEQTAEVAAHASAEIPSILLIVGVNGSGKTTTIGKLAHTLAKEGKRILVVGADTFRAAAREQLQGWQKHQNVEVMTIANTNDPAAVVFDACKLFNDQRFDHMIIDTAGRLQNRVNLMHELEKISRIVRQKIPNNTLKTWLVLDAMLGQNGLNQAIEFNKTTPLDGIVLTKLDGTGKAGIIFAISQELKIPIQYFTFGEKISDIKPFSYKQYINDLLEKSLE